MANYARIYQNGPLLQASHICMQKANSSFIYSFIHSFIYSAARWRCDCDSAASLCLMLDAAAAAIYLSRYLSVSRTKCHSASPALELTPLHSTLIANDTIDNDAILHSPVIERQLPVASCQLPVAIHLSQQVTQSRCHQFAIRPALAPFANLTE